MTSFSEYRRQVLSGEADMRAAEAALPPDARSFQGDRAGFPTRLTACLIDVAIIITAVFAIWAGLWLLFLVIDPTQQLESPHLGSLIVVGYFLIWAYWTLAWATSGRSVGAWVMGVRVINRTGTRVSWPWAALRSAFCLGFPFGLLWVLFSRRNRSLQDSLMRTNVIYDWVVRLSITKQGQS